MGDPPFRAEVIGSLLRPRILKDTATAIANGKAAAADYQAVLEREIGRVVAAPIRRRAPITLAEYQRVKRFARTALPKATLPTPSAFHFFRFTQPFDPAVYDQQRYVDDLVAVYRTELAELAEAGCRYVQMDEVPVAMLCDPLVREQARAQGGDPDSLLDLYVGVMRRVLEGRPAGMTVGMHLCRGNFRSRWMASGGYEPVATRLFNDFPVDVYFLE